MTVLPPDSTTPDRDFEEALIQAMDTFAHDTPPPAFDGGAILRRTRRRRAVRTATASAAAVLVLGVGTALALHPSGGPTLLIASGPSVSSAPAAAPTPMPTPPQAASPTPPFMPTRPAPWTHNAAAQPGLVTVPSVLGMSRTRAEQVLGQAGLRLFPIQSGSDPQSPADTVLAMQPAAGTDVAAGTSVVLSFARNSP
ncbi:PASTA domain-containing protein [Kitasatospora mediocidica]|uniref:PASTA domain-containing protein n=1 Tax=Kitasatospora mediocidica TaxID=58352 RepID=UPI0006895F5A|nr:PASTA domain-containing protein [Kitasatospora mediocidica]